MSRVISMESDGLGEVVIWQVRKINNRIKLTTKAIAISQGIFLNIECILCNLIKLFICDLYE